MIKSDLPTIIEGRRLVSPTVTPQALAFHRGVLWMGSRDLRRVYAIEAGNWKVLEEKEAPGIPWAAVSVGDEIRFTIGEGEEDDRYIWRFIPDQGFESRDRVACPERTGSYLSYDGQNLYLSQWYKHRVLKLSEKGDILRAIDVGAEICGHVFVEGMLYILRGTEQPDEEWRIARLDPREDKPAVIDLAAVPFACRSLAFDGESFWTNYRANNETISFSLPR